MNRELQQFLNYFLKDDSFSPLTEDGIIGRLSRAAIDKAVERLKTLFADRNWVWDNNFNFIGLRIDKDFDDRFEDWFIVYAHDTLVAVPCSTVAGITSVRKYTNLVINGRIGVGTILGNQQIDYLLVRHTDKRFWNPHWTGGLGFLFQDTPIDILRGAKTVNGVLVYDESNIVRQTMGGFNVHSWIGFIWSIVGNLSEGCQVCREPQWRFLFNVLCNNSRKVNDTERITYSLIEL